jgi:NAD(P)-dependent dehydrogenase (short-subunit alcohol dehydrogenase family)
VSILIIGGSTGIGKAVDKHLFDLKHEPGYDAAGVVMATGKEGLDVNSRASIRRVISEFESEHGHLTHLVYSAGINRLQEIGKTWDDSFADFTDVIDTNLIGFMMVIDYLAATRDRMEKPIRVVAISSDAAERPMRTSMAYCASKAGLNMAVRCAARELGPYGWRINAVSPGMTAPTGMSEYIDKRVPEVRNWTPEAAAHYERSQEVVPGRIHPSEVAEVVVGTLFGPDHLNGSIITINGGR